MLRMRLVLEFHRVVKLARFLLWFIITYISKKKAGVNSANEYVDIATRFSGLLLFVRRVGKDCCRHHNNHHIYRKTCEGRYLKFSRCNTATNQ